MIKSTASWDKLLAGLVVVYIVVALIDYTDYPLTDTHPPLTSEERAGLDLWRQNNCQACHRIYGFGGYFGPDLTNRVGHETPDVIFDSILTDGSGRMPAFNFSETERASIVAFLRAVNETGVSQPRPYRLIHDFERWEHFGRVSAAWEAETNETLDASASLGRDVWERERCGICHIPFQLGEGRAPDLARSALDRSSAVLGTVLTTGPGIMPAFELEAEEVDAMSEYLEWFATHRGTLITLNEKLVERPALDISALPWWEFPR